MRQFMHWSAQLRNDDTMTSLTRHLPPSFKPVDYLLGTLLLAYPALLFLFQGGMNGSLFLIAGISILLLIARRRDFVDAFDRPAMLFGITMASGIAVVLVSQLYHDDLRGRYFDSDARFLLAVPVMLVLRQLNQKTLSLIQYALPLGAIAALAKVMAIDPTVTGYASTPFLNHIHLGDLSLLLAILSLMSLNWFEKDGPLVKALKIAGFLAGMVVCVLSSARGGWLAVPVIVAVTLYSRNRHRFARRLLFAMSAIAAALVLGYFFVDRVHERLWMIYSDLTSYSAGQKDTSVGIRLQLWKAAAHMIAEHPILGVGADGFGRAMDGLSASGVITQDAAAYGKGEVHNEILAQTVRFGIFGLFFILALYFVPFLLFFRAEKTADRVKKLAAVFGMCVTLGFFVFGLTVETFDLKMTAAFYSLTVAVLLAIAINRHVPGKSEASGGVLAN